MRTESRELLAVGILLRQIGHRRSHRNLAAARPGYFTPRIGHRRRLECDCFSSLQAVDPSAPRFRSNSDSGWSRAMPHWNIW